jgi:ATP-dependent DNA helicase RecG
MKAAQKAYADLSTHVFPELKVGLLHGKLPTDEKEATMAAFQRGDVQVLVSTTVIEVGVDVPNATVMIVENAERFGLAQIHQLRGRVGRGSEQSYCVLVTEKLNELGRERIRTLVHWQPDPGLRDPRSGAARGAELCDASAFDGGPRRGAALRP